MRDPKDVLEQGKRVKRQLAAMDPMPDGNVTVGVLDQVKAEARALFASGRYKHLLAHLRDTFSPSGTEPSPVLAKWLGGAETAIARCQAKVCWDYLEDLSKPEQPK